MAVLVLVLLFVFIAYVVAEHPRVVVPVTTAAVVTGLVVTVLAYLRQP
ncbi:hypothetical protein [Streptomyces sp. NBC_00147]